MNKDINDKHVIHKYYPPTEYSIDALINHYFWFSKREFLNDPFDLGNFSRGRTLLNTQEQLIANILKSNKLDISLQRILPLIPEYACCSFSRSKLNKQMWAYYAKDYKGWCLTFEKGKLNTKHNSPLLPVIYVDDNLYTITPPINHKKYGITLIDQAINEVLCTKHQTWQHEEEERIVLQIKRQSKGEKRLWGSYKLIGITIGYNITEPYRSILGTIANKEKIKIDEVKLSNKDFELTI